MDTTMDAFSLAAEDFPLDLPHPVVSDTADALPASTSFAFDEHNQQQQQQSQQQQQQQQHQGQDSQEQQPLFSLPPDADDANHEFTDSLFPSGADTFAHDTFADDPSLLDLPLPDMEPSLTPFDDHPASEHLLPLPLSETAAPQHHHHLQHHSQQQQQQQQQQQPHHLHHHHHHHHAASPSSCSESNMSAPSPIKQEGRSPHSDVSHSTAQQSQPPSPEQQQHHHQYHHHHHQHEQQPPHQLSCQHQQQHPQSHPMAAAPAPFTASQATPHAHAQQQQQQQQTHLKTHPQQQPLKQQQEQQEQQPAKRRKRRARKTPAEMTPEELADLQRKRERRMQRNRESASASRRRKKELMERLEHDLQAEKDRNSTLSARVQELEARNKELESTLAQLEDAVQKTPALLDAVPSLRQHVTTRRVAVMGILFCFAIFATCSGPLATVLPQAVTTTATTANVAAMQRGVAVHGGVGSTGRFTNGHGDVVIDSRHDASSRLSAWSTWTKDTDAGSLSPAEASSSSSLARHGTFVGRTLQSVNPSRRLRDTARDGDGDGVLSTDLVVSAIPVVLDEDGTVTDAPDHTSSRSSSPSSSTSSSREVVYELGHPMQRVAPRRLAGGRPLPRVHDALRQQEKQVYAMMLRDMHNNANANAHGSSNNNINGGDGHRQQQQQQQQRVSERLPSPTGATMTELVSVSDGRHPVLRIDDDYRGLVHDAVPRHNDRSYILCPEVEVMAAFSTTNASGQPTKLSVIVPSTFKNGTTPHLMQLECEVTGLSYIPIDTKPSAVPVTAG
ncbi:hypothetical protein PTSG_06240 [Salpingoeca rosetta]|uniref:BZIP domain-containing protein n=1 Tax=Salpingoeca rosetta (strain ATCC 50818 / BSB-021) TaxID=946362 RepID=F2UCC3_SALR5|nr:uncharacterized protein PTSG_06240 [Salpingoeca rosetta]EGD74230.1 hypothetical protein PTSG_06240 [Salpingoeca rosetta]|eukprot:XP_004993130.1 hypothetical protein PTSG_06240 [Salpingoeca rosetta]